MSDGLLAQNMKENLKKSNTNKKKKKKRGGAKKRLNLDQSLAYKSVCEWVFLGQSSPSVCLDDDFGVQINKCCDKLVFDLHCHSICSDGFLSPSKLVERAHQNGVSFFCFLIFLNFFFFFLCS